MTEQGAVQPRLRRSYLAVPGSSQKMLQRAASLPADDVFLDLEDSVASHAKTDESREKVVRALIENECAARTLAVRVNHQLLDEASSTAAATQPGCCLRPHRRGHHGKSLAELDRLLPPIRTNDPGRNK